MIRSTNKPVMMRKNLIWGSLSIILVVSSLVRYSRLSQAASALTTNGNTYFISQSGNDSNPGTQAQPWKTIQKCLNQVQPGDTCEVFGGTYNESLVLKTSGTQSARITLKNHNQEFVTINSGGAQTLVTGGRIHYYTIDGLRFIANYASPGQWDYTIHLVLNVWDGYNNRNGGNNGCIFRNCYIEGAIKFYGHNNLVEN